MSLTFTGLKTAINKLDAETQAVSVVLEERAKMLREIGEDTASVAEMIAEMGIDTTTVEECRSVAQECGALTQGATGFLNALADVRTASGAMRDSANSEDGGIQEAVDSSPVDATEINREWFRTE